VSRNIFMNLLGIPTLQTMNVSVAEQRITDIEIMLVLDVSGSMDGSKINNLRIAARDFIDQVKEDDDENRISIGVIPYNAQVNLGDELAAQYNLTHPNGVTDSNCVEIPTGTDASNIFQSLAMPTTYAMPMMTAADTESSSPTSDTYYNWKTDTKNATPVNDASQRWCNPSRNTEITLPTKNITKAKSGISALVADGNTSILLGMRWATALLDPSARTIYDNLIDRGAMDADMRDRPFSYNNTNNDDDDSLKVIVLMTDGQHVAHGRIADAYNTGPATISYTYRPSGASRNTTETATVWRSSAGEWSVFFPSKVSTTSICASKPYWVPSTSSWQNRPFGATAASPDCYNPGRVISPTLASVAQWETIWSTVRMDYALRQFFARAAATGTSSSNTSTRTAAYNAVRGLIYTTYVDATTMNRRLAANCVAARKAGVLVYGIAFQAPAAGKAAIESCTSTPTSTYYFDVAETTKIQDAFRMIATNLSQLKLTQ